MSVVHKSTTNFNEYLVVYREIWSREKNDAENIFKNILSKKGHFWPKNTIGTSRFLFPDLVFLFGKEK